MKKILLTISTILALATSLQGQERTQKSYKRDGNAFVQTRPQTSESDTRTAYVWLDSKGREYPIILHTYTKGEKKGRTTAYVIRKSAKTGREYKYYIPNGEDIAKEIINENR